MIKSLKEIAEITMGQSPKSSAYNQNQIGLPFLQGRTTFGRIYPSFDTWTTEWNKECKANDVLFTVRAPVGDVNIAQTKIALGRGVASVRAINISPKYLYYLLYANKSNFIASSSGTIYDSINKDQLENIKLHIHNDEEQRHIVDTIGTVDDLIEKYENQITNLQKYSSLLYEKYQNQESNSQVKLGTVCEIVTGKLNANESSENGQYPFFTCSQEESKIDYYSFDTKAIIVAGNGDISVKYFEGKFNAYQRTYVLHPNKHFYLFLKECENSILSLKSFSRGSVIKFITKDMLENITINLNYNSDYYNEKIGYIYKNIMSLKNKIIKLKQEKQLLLNKYFG